jgi:hypothetical protein
MHLPQAQAVVSTRELVLFLPYLFKKQSVEYMNQSTTCNLIQPYLRHIPPPPIRFPSDLLVFFLIWFKLKTFCGVSST